MHHERKAKYGGNKTKLIFHTLEGGSWIDFRRGKQILEDACGDRFDSEKNIES